MSQEKSDVGQAARERYWHEMGVEQKVEKLMYIVLQQADTIEHLRETLLPLRLHQHGANGELLAPLNTQIVGEQMYHANRRNLRMQLGLDLC